MADLRIVSFGGGVQSHALLVLAAQKKVAFDTFVFANVGNDSENPGTIAYMQEYTYAYAEQHGLALHEAKHWQEGEPAVHSRNTLYQRVMKAGPQGGQFVGLPVKIGAKGIANRGCTQDYKVRAIVDWCRAHGATLEQPATTALGISTDEFQRAKNTKVPYQNIVYPLLEMRLSRANCLYLIEQAGLPRPPKSSCFFCPYHSKAAWANLQRDSPDLFAKAAEMERVATERRASRGYGPVFFHDRRVPLPMAVRPGDETDDEENTCESGYCHV
jgi:hypothetical protein